VILFLRLGWIVAHAGILLGTVIILLATAITTITTLSLSAITTNGLIQGGGPYYVISRNLGPQFGGAIGLLLFLAQSIATGFYLIGFAESVIDLTKGAQAPPFTGDFSWDKRVIALITALGLLLMALIGVGWIAKTQFVLLLILAVAITALFVGAFFPGLDDAAGDARAGFVGFNSPAFSENFLPRYIVDPTTLTQSSFFGVFSVFFPAVSGIMAGASLSGNLKNPGQAIPAGTLGAIVVTSTVYVAIIWFLGSVVLRCVDPPSMPGVCSADNFGTLTWANQFTAARLSGGELPGGLYFNLLIAKTVNIWGPLLYAGVFAATLSSAIATLIGAPRVIQALARDGVFNFEWMYFFSQLPRPMKESEIRKDADGHVNGYTAEEIAAMDPPEPVRAYYLTFVIACLCILIGEVNLVAPVISQFFLISFCLINYAAFAASISKAPGWRPKFRYYNPYVAAVAALLCFGLMFAFDWINALVAWIIGYAAYMYVDLNDPEVDWGTASDALRYLNAMRSLHSLSRVRTDAHANVHHAKVFRPSYLVVLPSNVAQPKAGPAVHLVHQLWRGRGLSVIAQVLQDPTLATAELGLTKFESTTDLTAPRAAAEPSETPMPKVGESVALIPPGSIPSLILLAREHRKRINDMLDALCESNNDRAVFTADALHASTTRSGIRALMEMSGVGGLRTNTLVTEWPFDSTSSIAYNAESHLTRIIAPLELAAFEGTVCEALTGRQAVMIVRDPTGALLKRDVPKRKLTDVLSKKPVPSLTEDTIDVWWLDWDGGLALLVPWLLQQAPAFAGKRLRVFTSGSHDGTGHDATIAADERTKGLARLIQMLRFDAHPRSLKLNLTDASGHGISRFAGMVPTLLTDETVEAAFGRARAKARSRNPDEKDMSTEDVTVEVADEDGAVAIAAGVAEEATAPVPADSVRVPSTPPPEEVPETPVADDGVISAGIKVLTDEQRDRLVEMSLWIIRAGDLIREHSSRAAVTFVVFPAPRKWYPVGVETAWMDSLTHSLASPTVLIRGNGARVVSHTS
jgi:amino acid transporter